MEPTARVVEAIAEMFEDEEASPALEEAARYRRNIMSATYSSSNCNLPEYVMLGWDAVGGGVDCVAWCPRQWWTWLAELQPLKGVVPFERRRYAAH